MWSYWVYVCVFCTLSSVQSVSMYCLYVNCFCLEHALKNFSPRHMCCGHVTIKVIWFFLIPSRLYVRVQWLYIRVQWLYSYSTPQPSISSYSSSTAAIGTGHQNPHDLRFWTWHVSVLVGSDTSDLDVHWALFNNNFSRAFHFGESFGIKPSSALDKGCVRTQTTSPTWNIVCWCRWS